MEMLVPPGGVQKQPTVTGWQLSNVQNLKNGILIVWLGHKDGLAQLSSDETL